MEWSAATAPTRVRQLRMVAPLVDMLEQGRRRGLWRKLADRLGLIRSREVPIYYDPNFRLPLAPLEAVMGVEPRRADFVVWYLLESGAIAPEQLHAPERILYADLARVHPGSYLESLSSKETLAPIFAVDPSELPVDEVLHSIRLAAGGTLDAARAALKRRGPTVNLLGGFHHAFPDKGSGLCAVNDMAVAVAALREEGFAGQVAIIDLDAHPPDGTAACFRGDTKVWIGSLSGTEWTPPEGVDDVTLPQGCPDEPYLEALTRLLTRMPPPALAFVIAGGDVLANDRFGRLGLTVDGVRRRDLKVAAALAQTGSVWLPGGGYHEDAWRLLAGTYLAVAWGSRERIPESYDPLSARFAQIWDTFGRESSAADPGFFTAADIEDALRVHGTEHRLLLGAYSAESIEFAMHHSGILNQLQRLGYHDFHVEVDEASPGERMRLFGEGEGGPLLLLECVLERKKIRDNDALYVHWMTLRNPKAHFSNRRPQLPGQEVPGLGLMREAGEMLARMARRLGLQAIVFRPAWYHMAYAARYRFRYIDPHRQACFEAIVRDLGRVPLREVTMAFAEGRVRANGEPYAWEADEMAYWLDDKGEDRRQVEAERALLRFTIVPRHAAAPVGVVPVKGEGG